MATTIWYQFDIIRFWKDFSVCILLDILLQREIHWTERAVITAVSDVMHHTTVTGLVMHHTTVMSLVTSEIPIMSIVSHGLDNANQPIHQFGCFDDAACYIGLSRFDTHWIYSTRTWCILTRTVQCALYMYSDTRCMYSKYKSLL